MRAREIGAVPRRRQNFLTRPFTIGTLPTCCTFCANLNLQAASMRSETLGRCGEKHQKECLGRANQLSKMGVCQGFLKEFNEEAPAFGPGTAVERWWPWHLDQVGQAYHRYLMRELTYSASKTSAEELEHVLDQVACGLAISKARKSKRCQNLSNSIKIQEFCTIAHKLQRIEVDAGLGKSVKSGFRLRGWRVVPCGCDSTDHVAFLCFLQSPMPHFCRTGAQVNRRVMLQVRIVELYPNIIKYPNISKSKEADNAIPWQSWRRPVQPPLYKHVQTNFGAILESMGH